MSKEKSEQIEIFKFWKELQKDERKDTRVQNVEGLMALKNKGFEIHSFTEYHYSIIKDGFRIDYYPTNSRYHIVSSGKRGNISFDALESLFKIHGK